MKIKNYFHQTKRMIFLNNLNNKPDKFFLEFSKPKYKIEEGIKRLLITINKKKFKFKINIMNIKNLTYIFYVLLIFYINQFCLFLFKSDR